MNRPDQSRREHFEETARQIGADESGDALDCAMDRLDLKAKPKPEGHEQGGSDDGNAS